ncbi:hypothetical protein LshimejAT787_2200050 [Lyophyllum shimeji]|uniref:Integrase catalytic domain-containing protein n=1 Tax=Lyophyllum shimeji TaxID=47721 RepID=A0A9P3UUN7_LYOSH|nr:hypothetical protein LshimejAT787_2200050 [Lyophyllum shimeji]
MREKKLTACKLEEGEKVAGEGGHIERMRRLRTEANDAGASITNSRFITILLDSFPASWDPLVTPMYDETDLSKVIMNLTTHAERLAIHETENGRKPTAIDTVKALEASVLALQAEIKNMRSNRGGTSNPDKAHLKCTNVAYCGKTGHLIEDCFQTGGGKAGQYPSWWKGKRTAVAPSANLATTSSTADGPVTAGTHYALSATFDENAIAKIIEENAPIDRKVALVATNNLDPLSSCLVADSGCTAYFFKSRDSFKTYKPLNKVVGQSSKESANFSVIGVGNVEVRVLHKNVEHTLQFRDSLHAPDVTANLLSISKMDLAGWDIVFGGQKVRFFKNKMEVFAGTLKNGLYFINGSITTNIPTALTARSLRSPVDISTWHRRFAHFGTARIVEASKLVDGLEITKEKVVGQCEDCIVGNQKRRAYDDTVSAEQDVLKLTNIDIWGPARVKSAGGALYAMKFHDNGSSHRRTFFLPNRLAETTLDALRTYKLESEKITGKVMVHIRTDNAPEFKSQLWTEFFREHGLIFVPTAPYSSASNGTVERSIGVTTGAVRVMILDAGLSAKWWAEAWEYADTVENRLPSSRHPGVIPEERWTGQKQDVGHFRVWGCIAYVHIPSEKGGGKLADRGQKGRLMGVEGQGLYRILIPETGQVIRPRNVRFEEGFGHRTLTAEGEYFVDDDGDKDYDFLGDEVDSTTINNDNPALPAPPPTLPSNEPPKPRIPRPRIVYPPASRKSSRLAGKITEPTEPTTVPDNGPTDETVPILEDNDEVDESPTALSADIPPEPLNKFVPTTFEDAFDISRRHLWYPAMAKEIERWDERGVVTPVPRPEGINTIKTRWVFDLKLDGDGNLVRRRARGVVKGFTQKKGEHYFESFAAVVRYESERMLIALIAAHGWKMHLVDVAGAFLNAKPQGENYLEIPQGFENHYTIPNTNTVLKMNLNLYGTMDGANNWARLLNKTFTELRHRQSTADPCVRIQYTSDGGLTVSATYTDDVLSGSSTDAAETQTVSEIGKAFEITDHGRPNVVLGMSIIHHASGNISIHQKPLIMKALTTFGMANANPKYTPLPPNVNLADTQPTPIPPNDEIYMRDKSYRSALGMLNHIANGTRPDIAFSVMVLMRYATDPRPVHWRLVLHLLAYLKATVNLVITYRKGGVVKPIGYSDASYADDPDTRRSSAGYVFMSAGGPVGWKAKTQQRVSTSTGEAEYVGIFEAGKQAMWVTSWYLEVDQYFDLPVTVFCDNDAAVSLSQNTSGHSKVKHVAVKTHWIREAVDCGDIHIEPIPSDDNLADIFTKSLPRPRLERLIKMMGMEILDI